MYKPVDAGTRLEHHMYNGPFGSSLDVMAGEGLRARGPRLLSTKERPRWKHCALTVTECQVSEICCCYWHRLSTHMKMATEEESA